MPSLPTVRNSNALFSPRYLPVAVFVGGTSGVGQGLVEAFARHTKGNAHIIIIGRSESSANSILSSLPAGSVDGAKHEFLQCDVQLMSNIRALESRLPPKVNFLFMSQGIMTTQGFTPTSEGNDQKLALHYYSRFEFTRMLLPALVKAQEQGEDSRVFSVFSAGYGGAYDFTDLGLKKNYSLRRAALQGTSYNDLVFEEFARRYPQIAFAHAFPGGVRTNLFTRGNAILGCVATTLSYPFTVSVEEAGEYLLYGALNMKHGFSRIDNKGDDMGKKNYFDASAEDRRKFWEHTWEAAGHSKVEF